MTPNPGAQTKRPPGIGDNGGWVNGVFYKLFFYRDNNGSERGPIDQGLLEALRLSGYIDKDTVIREKNSSVWQRLDGKQVKHSDQPTKKLAPPIPRSYGAVENQGSKSTNELERSLKIIGGVAALVVLVIIIAASNSNSSSTNSLNTRTTASSYSPATSSTPYPTPQSVPLPTSTPIVPVYSSTPYPTPRYSSGSYSQNDGATYRVSHNTSQSHNFSARKALLDSKSAQLDREKSQLNTLGNEIDLKRTYLDRTSQYDIDNFNEKVRSYNYQKQILKAKLDAFNREVDQYNSELEQVGRRQ